MAALHVAAKCGNIDICTMLLNQGASLELKSGQSAKEMTPLHFAAEGGHSKVIKLLLDRGASPGARSKSQSTPFYRAARSGSLEALKLLYVAGSDINARTWDNWTALFESVIRGLTRSASQLLEWGADPTIVTDTGESALKIISVARSNDSILVESQEDIMLSFGTVSEDRHLLELIEKREAQTLQEIQSLQTQARASDTSNGEAFCEYLGDLDLGYWRLERIENDTRPGVERDLFRLGNLDVG